MVKVAKLHEKTMSADFSWYGEKIKFEYKPGARRTGTGYFEDLQAGINDGDPDKIMDAVAKFLVSWDLEMKVGELIDAGYYEEKTGTDDEGNEVVVREELSVPGDLDEYTMVPCDPWGLRAADLPQTVYGALQDAVNDDMGSGGQGTKKAR